MASLCKRGVTLVVRLIRDASGLVRLESKNKTTERTKHKHKIYIIDIESSFFFSKKKVIFVFFF